MTEHEFSLLMSKDSDYMVTAVSNSSGEHRKLIVIEQMACHEIPLQKVSYMYGRHRDEWPCSLLRFPYNSGTVNGISYQDEIPHS
ncbi:hypothetical protein AVEN_161105-1 [Araneus ventricosus]|uniref:Uncharacterized protein n=1 Tax=Araneus ventricosus TaxID=182803 RepID=A0A4Y2TFY8_ARAVE|nr:hypothetical protein AVEN_161105-1 [Araneus ventricosus]